jgi:hypothetical protein
MQTPKRNLPGVLFLIAKKKYLAEKKRRTAARERSEEMVLSEKRRCNGYRCTDNLNVTEIQRDLDRSNSALMRKANWALGMFR